MKNNNMKIYPIHECDICYEEVETKNIHKCGNDKCTINICINCGKEHVKIKQSNKCPQCQQEIKHKLFKNNNILREFTNNSDTPRENYVHGILISNIHPSSREIIQHNDNNNNSDTCNNIYKYICIDNDNLPYYHIRTTSGRNNNSTRYSCFKYCSVECNNNTIKRIDEALFTCCILTTCVGLGIMTKGIGYFVHYPGKIITCNTTIKKVFITKPSIVWWGELCLGIVGWIIIASGSALTYCFGCCVGQITNSCISYSKQKYNENICCKKPEIEVMDRE